METLPIEMKEEVTSHLRGRDLGSLFQAERGFAELSREEKFWKQKYRKDFPKDFAMSWKEKYQRRAEKSILGKMETFIDVVSDKYSFNIYLRGPYPINISFNILPSDLEDAILNIERDGEFDINSFIGLESEGGLNIYYNGHEMRYVSVKNFYNNDIDTEIDSELFLHILQDVHRSFDEGFGENSLTYFDDGTSWRDA